MDKKSTFNLQNKLKAYSTLAGAAVGVAATGQVVYQDIDPDAVIDEVGDFYDLDLNQDGVMDFRIEFTDEILFKYGDYMTLNFEGIKIKGFGKNNRVRSDRYGKAMNAADTLGDSVHVYDPGAMPVLKAPGGPNFYMSGVLRGMTKYNYLGNEFEGYPVGEFENVEDKYIGLMFQANGMQHLGWVRLSVEDELPEPSGMGPKAAGIKAAGKERSVQAYTIKATVKDYAYNMIPFPMGTLKTGVGPSLEPLPTPQNVAAADISNNFNATDLEVTFDAASDETNVHEYGCIIVKTEKVNDISLKALIESEGGEAVTVTPNGSASYTVNFNSSQQDMDGDPIVAGRSYTILAYSMNYEFEYEARWAFSNAIELSVSDQLATGIAAEDVADAGNASDMQVSFTKAADETGITEYRIMIVPEGNINVFDSATAAAVVAANYTAVTPDGSNPSLTLAAGALTYNGLAINQGNDYAVYVVSSLSAGGVLVSGPSPLIRLGIPAPKITGLVVEDINDTGTGWDIRASFMAPDDLTNIYYARYIFVEKSVAQSMSDEQIMDLRYTQSRYYGSLTASERDTSIMDPGDYDGFRNPLREGVTYWTYVVSTPRNGSNKSSLSDPVEIMLQGELSAANELLVVNNGRNFNPTDWKIIATQSANEARVDEYRIMAVPAANMGSFDLAAAEAVAEGNYVAISPMDKQINEIMPADLKDVDGNNIDSKTEYQFVILTVGNSSAKAHKLSEPSLVTSLEVTNGIERVELTDGSIYFGDEAIHFRIEGLNVASKVQVISMSGQLVLVDQISNGQARIEASQLQTGIYVVRVIGDEKFYVSKVLVK